MAAPMMPALLPRAARAVAQGTVSSGMNFSPFLVAPPPMMINSGQKSLWIYEIQEQRKQLITKELSESITPQWSTSGDWIAFFINEN